MSLWILQNQYAPNVLADLRTICPDPGLKVDLSGRISYIQTTSGVGCDLIAQLQHFVAAVSLRGENANFSTIPLPGETLATKAGVTVPDSDTRPARGVDIIYDVSGCNGRGYMTVDPFGILIDLPSDVILFHELSHALESLLFTGNPNDPEATVIQAENRYRASRGLPLRGSELGGCRGQYTPGTTPTGGQGTSASQRVAPAICTPLLTSFPAIGTNHSSANVLAAGESTYKVNINNQTTDTFTQIVVFYKRIGISGVVYLRANEVTPGQVTSFMCGVCKEFESYVVGFFIGDDLVAQIPETGNMTPALASALNPSDQYPCIDSWSIS